MIKIQAAPVIDAARPESQTIMNTSSKPFSQKIRYVRPLLAVFMAVTLAGSFSAFAQSGELSLADLLIALRSKKASMPEKNKLLADAVNERGITFTLTPEIEKELTATGANEALLRIIRIRQVPSRTAEAKPAPQPTPTPPDYKFYAKRAEESSKKGDFRLALADYNKAVEMKSNEPAILLGRADTYFNLKEFNNSIADYDTFLRLNPNSAVAFYSRARALEESGELLKSAEDYRKALEIEPENSAAKTALVRVLSALMAEVKAASNEAEKPSEAAPDSTNAAKEATSQPEAAKPVPDVGESARFQPDKESQERPNTESSPVQLPVTNSEKPETAPEFVDAGTLSKQNADRMVVPTYPVLAQRSRIEGRIVVEVELDTEGNVVAARASNGQQMLKTAAEDAAKKSKFKPVLFNGTPNKAKGIIIYNFSLNGTE